MNNDRLLEVDSLKVVIDGDQGPRHVLQSVSLQVPRGGRVGIVGESGSGKTMTARATIGLLPYGGRVVGGQVRFEGRELTGLSNRDLREVRGAEIGMTFQNARACLDPLTTVGAQIAGVYRHHHPEVSRKQAKRKAVEMLGQLGIPDPGRRSRSYPHEFSGGMAQRAMIALALVCYPKLLIADEPTTGLDVTVEEQVLTVIDEMIDELEASLIFISHDLRIVAEMCDEVVVMYGGTVVERGPTETILGDPVHPYTKGLVSAAKVTDAERMATIPGRGPKPAEPHKHCPFADRCPEVMPECRESVPQLRVATPSHDAACFLVEASHV